MILLLKRLLIALSCIVVYITHYYTPAYGEEAGAKGAVRLIRGVSGQPVPLPIPAPATGLNGVSLLKIGGVPKKLSLSSGFLFGEAWAVSIKEADKLAILSPEGFDGEFMLDIQYIKHESPGGERQTVRVEIRPPLNTVTPQEEATALNRGQELLRSGDISSARTVFERLAKRGSASAAYAAGLSYDPLFLKTLKVVGLNGDVKKANSWYQRAAQLGSQDAIKRLRGASPQ